MKILMITPYLPFPPSSGGQVRSYNLIKHLARQHQITLVSLIKSPEEENYVKELIASPCTGKVSYIIISFLI